MFLRITSGIRSQLIRAASLVTISGGVAVRGQATITWLVPGGGQAVRDRKMAQANPSPCCQPSGCPLLAVSHLRQMP